MAKDAAYQQALEKIRQARRQKATKLDLSGMRLTELPPDIAQLTNLQTLDLRLNQLTALPGAIAQLTNLQTLNLSRNQLTALPEAIAQLTNLQTLELSNNQLTTLPEAIAQLSNLQRLGLGGNQLTALPEAIDQLTNLQELDLNDNQLTALPETIGQLTNLQTLNLSVNQLTALPETIGQLTNLQTLYLIDNQLTALPETIAQLTNLQRLDLSVNRLTALPEAIAQLTNLQRLYLSVNQLTTLPEAIGQLTNLQRLYLIDNQLTTLPEAIGQLTNLQRLYLIGNQLTALPEAIAQLTNLQTLDLRRNQLTALPGAIASLKQLEILVLENNPLLPIPPETIRKGWGEKIWDKGDPQAVIDYCLDLLAQGKQPLNEAKMILVGEGGVGKTSLVRQLFEEKFDPTESKTDGIDIRTLDLNLTPHAKEAHDVRLNIWDFGGQVIMHTTHQFFLTHRSLYLLVVSNRKEEENRLEYWLNIIQSFAEDSPVIVVANKSDEHFRDLNEKDLRQKYPNIKAFISTSCKDGTGIDDLVALIRQEINDLPHVGDPLPIPWFAVKEHLESLEKDYIPYEEYAKICVEYGITEDGKQKSVVSLLHDLGIVLNFHDDPNVNDTHVINPEWLTGGIYRIINDDALTTKFKGVLSFGHLATILPNSDYPEHKYRFIIAMMKKFELCFALSDVNDAFLIPNCLPQSTPDDLDETQWQDALRFEYHYPVLSQSIISRFIVKMHGSIVDKTWWRTGVVLEEGQNQALVKADLYDKKIFIAINGAVNTRRDFLAAIRSCFYSIHKTFSENSQPEEKIPIPNHPTVPPVDYQYLLDLEEMGETSFIPPGLKQRINIRELLNSIKPIPSDQEKLGRIPGDIYFHGETTVNMPNVQQIHSGSGDNVGRDKNVTYNNNQNLTQAAQDIKDLIAQLQDDYPSNPMGNMQMGTKIVTHIEQNPTLKGRVLNALKEAGAEALQQAISHPVAGIVIAAVKGFAEAD